MYRRRKPFYQAVLLNSLRGMWAVGDRRVLDVGGGTGVIAQAIKELFPVDQVTSVDVVDRYLSTLDIETSSFDGANLPFTDGAFDCVLLINVLHHVPQSARRNLLRECARVTASGHVYIKDHVAESWLDSARLTVLDVVGNTPFGGMVRASYPDVPSGISWLRRPASGSRGVNSSAYRHGLLAGLFPNRLEIVMRWTKASTTSEFGPK